MGTTYVPVVRNNPYRIMKSIAEILEKSPKGTKLYSPICGECELNNADGKVITVTYVVRHVGLNNDEVDKTYTLCFDRYGRFGGNGECLLFPSSDNREWVGGDKPERCGETDSYRSRKECRRGFAVNPVGEEMPFVSTPPMELDRTCVFACEKMARSARAMARISQIIENDNRFGGPITDDEWNENFGKYTIERYKGMLCTSRLHNTFNLLAFHTLEQCDLFLSENEDLVKDYYMID